MKAEEEKRQTPPPSFILHPSALHGRTLTAMPPRALLFSLLIASVAVAQEAPVHTEPAIYVTAIDLLAEVRDANGQLPRDLKIEDFTVLEEGVERKVIGVEYLDAPPPSEPGASMPYLGEKQQWQIVVYFDTLFSSTINMRKIADSLSAQAEDLAAMGSVEVVTGDLTTSLVLRASRDPEEIRKGFKKAISRGAKDILTVQRRRFIADQDNKNNSPRGPTRQSPLSSGMVPTNFTLPMLRLDQVRPYVMEEIEMARRFQRNLMEWMARYPKQQPRLLLLVSNGFEYDPTAFYFASAQGSKDAQKAREEFSQYDLGKGMSTIAKTLAASSWTMISVDSPSGAGDEWIDDGSRSGLGRVRNLRVDEATRGASFTGSRMRDPLLEFADTTGGSVVQRAQIDEAIDGVTQRVRITYQVSRPPDGKPRRVTVKSNRPGITVNTMKWASEATPEDIAAIRVAQILKGGEPPTDLPTNVNVEWAPATTGRRSGKIVVKSSLSALSSLPATKRAAFRVTILAREKEQQPMLIHRIVNDYDTSQGLFMYTAPITAPANPLELVIAVEELSTGVWGGARALVQ